MHKEEKRRKTIYAGGMTVGKMRTGLSDDRVPSVQGTVLSKKDSVITYLMYPDHRGARESDKDYESGSSKWDYSEPDEPRSFETQGRCEPHQ